MKISYEIVRNGRNGLFFMKIHEKFVQTTETNCFGLFFMEIHENFVRNRTKSYEMAETASFSWKFMKISYEIVRIGRNGLFFMKIHEKFVQTTETNCFGLFFMEIHENFVRNGRNGLFFMKIYENIVRFRTN